MPVKITLERGGTKLVETAENWKMPPIDPYLRLFLCVGNAALQTRLCGHAHYAVANIATHGNVRECSDCTKWPRGDESPPGRGYRPRRLRDMAGRLLTWQIVEDNAGQCY